MEYKVESTLVFGKIGYTDAEISGAEPESNRVMHQHMAVMNTEVKNTAWVVVELHDYFRGIEDLEKIMEEDGYFAVIEVVEEDGIIDDGGALDHGPTSFQDALDCAIDRAMRATYL